MPDSDCPSVPSASGWPSWPIMITSRPWSRMRATSTCTLVTSGQVASNTLRPRSRASRCTSSETPCAEKITVAPAGTSESSSTKTAPFARRSSTTYLLCTISWRT